MTKQRNLVVEVDSVIEALRAVVCKGHERQGTCTAGTERQCLLAHGYCLVILALFDECARKVDKDRLAGGHEALGL
jgi:hypothetical protein